MILVDIIHVSIIALISLLLCIFAKYFDKVKSHNWNLLYIICFFTSAVFIVNKGVEYSLIPVYIADIILLLGFLKSNAKLRVRAGGIAFALAIISVGICLLNPYYRAVRYDKDFKEAFEYMKKHYVLTEHKNVDWDALYGKYEPLFDEAYKKQDKVMNYGLWMEFCSEFHDGHVGYSSNDKDTVEKYEEQYCGNDFGLSLMTLDSGMTVAVSVEEGSVVYDAGIRNGTQITMWNGIPIEEAKQNVDKTIGNYPCIESEDFYKSLLVAGDSSDEVNITFVNDQGIEEKLDVTSIGFYYERLGKTLEILNSGYDVEGLTVTEISADTALLRIRGMIYDTKAEESGDYSEVTNKIKQAISEEKEKGITNLVIDIRENFGGSPEYVSALVELFAPEGEHLYVYDGVYDKESMSYKKGDKEGTYLLDSKRTYIGQDIWDGQNITILVSANSISASDHFTKLMSEFDNVKIAGFTPSNCSFQAVDGIYLDYGTLQFSSLLLLNEDGTIFGEVGSDRKCTMPLDVKIPFDEIAVGEMFENGEDYGLNYVVKQIENVNSK